MREGFIISISTESLENCDMKDIIRYLNNKLGVDKDSIKHLHKQYVYLESNDFEILDSLRHIYGIEAIHICYKASIDNFENDLENIFDKIKKEFKKNRKRLQTFSIESLDRRSEKYKKLIVDYIKNTFRIKHNQYAPDLVLKILSTNNYVFVSVDELSGIGGIIFPTESKAVALVSGGPDSALAVLHACRSGLNIVGVYFDFGEETLRAKARSRVIRSMKLIAEKWGRVSKLYIVPFVDIVQNIITFSDPKNFFVLLKRYMMRTARKICEREHCEILISGEIIGEHASQTLWNLEVISSAVIDKIIIRPLLTWDKTEILNYLRTIDLELYKIVSSSIEPCQVSREIKPTTKADLKSIEFDESNIPVSDKMMEDVIERSFVIKF